MFGRGHRPDACFWASKEFQDFIRSEEGEHWLAAVVRKVNARAGAVGGRIQGVGDLAVDRLVRALRDPLTLDPVKAEWVAHQLLEAGEHGILLPLNVVLDAYVRGKARYFLKQHLLRSTAAMAAACTAVHLAKQGLKRGTRGVKYIGPAVAFASDVALPTSLLGGLIVARFML